MEINKIFLDVETGGLRIQDPLLQVAYIIEAADGSELKNDIRIYAKKEDCDAKALEINRLNPTKGLKNSNAFLRFKTDLDKYIKFGKYYFIGYNSHSFDSTFIRKWFTENCVRYNDYIYNPSIDLMLIAAGFCIGQRDKLGNFKQVTVARSLGVEVDSKKLHDASYDVEVARQIFNKIKNELNEEL